MHAACRPESKLQITVFVVTNIARELDMSSISLLACPSASRCTRAFHSHTGQQSWRLAAQAGRSHSSVRRRVTVCGVSAVIEKEEGDREGGTGQQLSPGASTWVGCMHLPMQNANMTYLGYQLIP